ncbi:MAG: response regulator [Cellulosilyticaceae bacterium]
MLKYVIADDERMIRLGLKLAIEDLGLPLEYAGEAKDGVELVDLLEIVKPDVIFVDIKMPRKDGLETIREAKTIVPETYWVILTGYSKFEYAKEAITLGVTDYLLKPIEPCSLKETVLRIQEEKEKKVKAYQKEILLSQNTMVQEGRDVLEEMKRYISVHYMEDLAIGDLADLFDITPAYASRLFHQKSGEKFIDYLIKIRMKHAKHIMEINPQLTVREVAGMVGYYSTRYFTKTFVKVYGCYPSEMKKNF